MSDKWSIPLVGKSTPRFIVCLSVCAGAALGAILLMLRAKGKIPPTEYSNGRILADVLVVALFFPVSQLILLRSLARLQWSQSRRDDGSTMNE